MFDRIFSATAFVLVMTLLGCGEGASTSPTDGGDSVRKSWPAYPQSLLASRISGTNVLVTVNGVAITADDYERFSRFNDCVFRFRKKIPFGQKNDEADRAWKDSGAKLLMYLIRREQARQEVARKGVVPDEDAIQRQQRAFLESINRPKASFDDVLKKFGAFSDILKKQIEEDAAVESALQLYSTNSLSVVTDDELKQRKDEVVKLVEELVEKNSNTVARAKAAREEVVSGGRFFADVAKERADLAKEQGRFWDVIELAELPASSPLAQWLIKAEFGDISEPLELEDGLAVVGVMSKEKGKSSELEGQDVDFYELARMLFTWYDPPEILDDDDEIREIMLQARRDEARNAFFGTFIKTDKIKFPSGEDIFRVKPNKPMGKPKKPAAKAKKCGKAKKVMQKEEKKDEDA